jgi:hypothetical protein
MAQEYDNTNRGSIWKNEKRETEKHPTHTGSINIDGKEYWLNGWVRAKDASEKAPAMSFSVRAKEAQNNAPKGSPSADLSDIDSDIPFMNPYKFNWRTV